MTPSEIMVLATNQRPGVLCPVVTTLEVVMTRLQVDTPGIEQKLLTSLQKQLEESQRPSSILLQFPNTHSIRCDNFFKPEKFTSVTNFTKLNQNLPDLNDSTSQRHKQGKMCSKALREIERM